MKNHNLMLKCHKMLLMVCVAVGYSRSCRRVKKKPQPLGEDATVLCERLEKKIAGLSKLGGQLQHENKSRGHLSVITITCSWSDSS